MKHLAGVLAITSALACSGCFRAAKEQTAVWDEAHPRAKKITEASQQNGRWEAFEAAHPKEAAEALLIRDHNNGVDKCRASFAAYNGPLTGNQNLDALIVSNDIAHAPLYLACGDLIEPPADWASPP